MEGNPMKTSLVLILIFCILGVVFNPISYAEYSSGPRQTGETVLNELLIGSTKFIIRVASNGGTDKNSFKINVQKEPGMSEKVPYYLLTIVRIKPDECKAIVDDGALIFFDLEKDLGLKGSFTYSITNRVSSSSSPVQSSDKSLLAIIEKYFTWVFPESKEIKPEPFEKFAMSHDYFTCYLPFHWKLDQDRVEDEETGIFEIYLRKTDKAQPEDSEEDLLPDPLIYAGYYSKNNQQHKNYDSYIKEYEEVVLKNKGSDKSRYEMPKEIIFNGKEAKELDYEVYLKIPRGPLPEVNYWLKVKFVVIKAKEGFYVLDYKSPIKFYDQYLSVFEEVAKTFQTLD
jgi:hypothetical protein